MGVPFSLPQRPQAPTGVRRLWPLRTKGTQWAPPDRDWRTGDISGLYQGAERLHDLGERRLRAAWAGPGWRDRCSSAPDSSCLEGHRVSGFCKSQKSGFVSDAAPISKGGNSVHLLKKACGPDETVWARGGQHWGHQEVREGEKRVCLEGGAGSLGGGTPSWR